MEPDGKTYLLPHLGIARIIFGVAGLFVLFIAPYELWRGVWPLNIFTPFFAFIMFGGMSVGAAFVYAGFIAPSAKLVFENGAIKLERHFLWGATTQVFRKDDVESITTIRDTQMDGPDDFHAVINVKGVKPLNSRPLSTEAAAKELVATFITLLA
jgi:hypothetical protein